MKKAFSELLSFQSPVVPLLILIFGIFTLAAIPYKIIGEGYLPIDDATRHAAFAMGDKTWNDILLLQEKLLTDTNHGWHFLLRTARKAANWDQLDLCIFSVAFLFILATIPPLFLLRRPEAWLLALLLVTAVDQNILTKRFLIGRPLLITTAYMLLFGFSWQKLAEKTPNRGALAAITAAAALSTWIHCSWYLLFLPCLALFLSREWRAGITLAVCVLGGIAAGAVLTGSPADFLIQTGRHFRLSLTGSVPFDVRVGEFKPAVVNLLLVALFCLALWVRKLRGRFERKVFADPVFILLLMGWFGGFLVGRLWTDVGISAGAVWLARELQFLLEEFSGPDSVKRLAAALPAAAVLFLLMTDNTAERWSLRRPPLYLTEESVGDASWLPGKGGIIYSNSMLTFYGAFFRNPGADWKYALGFEPGLMPAGDLETLINIFRNEKDAYKPWVAKMRPEDRLIIQSKRPIQLELLIPALQWKQVGDMFWCGRLPPKRALPR